VAVTDHDWWSKFQRWLKRLLKVQQQQPGIRVIKTWSTQLGTLHRLQRDVDGAIATHRFLPNNDGKYDLVITCDALRRSASASARKRRPTDERGSEPSWQRALANPGHPTPTHIFAVVKVARRPNAQTRMIDVHVDRAYLVDFVGIKVYENTDKYASIITAEIALQLLKIPDGQIDWEREIHEKASKRVNSNHEILLKQKQPT
jgi:hypothetical protein